MHKYKHEVRKYNCKNCEWKSNICKVYLKPHLASKHKDVQYDTNVFCFCILFDSFEKSEETYYNCFMVVENTHTHTCRHACTHAHMHKESVPVSAVQI